MNVEHHCRSGWLGWLPVPALEDSVARWSLGEAEAEEAVEADIEAEEDAGAGPGYEVQMSTIFRDNFTI